ncbi:MAG: alpha/beta fold hydrolase [Rhodospirillaceae bacterium]|jgi:pimeloyl-ACP methyl ester carboxylesterase|nr:alpha/beta fold hydrolase [Rhodospirillaceae bacterium]MBT3930479.1 alpha/beta fold hydrolase [Rhodospirillaceae bacterium]MBT5357092.1 alpha/beta fold hydrolase [Rhodospirillaceae bacterium]MBT5769207.1 alpha/beta fold hydrolase [Rhodospirillaceae bacterium]MBT6308804.1 alpha/beta fold hydrolase [Rhodospirillaceae bacterium]
MNATTQNLVMVPGLICDQEVWAYPRAYLSEVATISYAPADETDTMQGLAEAVLDSAPKTFAIAGFSMGGYVALEVLRQAPERVERIALLDTSSRADTPEKAAGREAAIADCEEDRFEDLLDRFVPQLLHPDRHEDPLFARVRNMGDRVGPDLFANRHRAMQTRSDARELLQGTDIPVRAIVGRSDALTSVAEHQEIADLAPRGRLSIIEDCGHMPPLERPQAATALLRDWLLYD